MERYPRHLSAGGLVLSEGSILLVRNRKGHWGLPKGHWENGELLVETAAREVREETGLSVAVGDLAFVTEFRNADSQEHMLQFFFGARLVGGQILARHGEISMVRWVKVAEIGQYIRWRPWLEPLQAWLAGESQRYYTFPNPGRNRL
jgi:ADP-ribose pyrophosphatase YjhB (NUDIX family)